MKQQTQCDLSSHSPWGKYRKCKVTVDSTAHTTTIPAMEGGVFRDGHIPAYWQDGEIEKTERYSWFHMAHLTTTPAREEGILQIQTAPPHLLMGWGNRENWKIQLIPYGTPHHRPLLGRKEVFRDRHLPHLLMGWWVRDTWGEDHLVDWNPCVTLCAYQLSIDGKNVGWKQMCLAFWWLPDILNAINISW